jgi:hypothetical protein
MYTVDLISSNGLISKGDKALKKQKKPGRASFRRMVHTAVVLPPELIERLKKAGEAAGHGLSTEIRQLLHVADLMRTSQDQKTSRLLNDIRHLSEKIEGDVGERWHENGYAHAAFRAGVLYFLTRHGSPGETNKRPDAAADAPSDDPPEAVGRTHARLIAMSDQDRGDEDPPA